VVAGTVCLDKYEASVWRVPDPAGANKGLVKKIQQGKATSADLTARGATQLGTASNNYAPCTNNGQNCANDIYAVSLTGVTPAAYATWFQAQEACANAGKRLPTSAEWQVGANGTPDPGGDNGTTDCNTGSTMAVAATGSRSACVSARGALDMVGNLIEWVADWVPASTGCPGWSLSNDVMCLSGASATTLGPGALLRGGAFVSGTAAGPLAVDGRNEPFGWSSGIGFRCAR
jgi:formylglycine-generating enzyme required for sulfatase activity